jgi:putative peptide zinc metalloprotease protein
VRSEWSDGTLSGMGVGVLAMASIAVPVLSICYLICRVTYRTSSSVWRKTEGRPVLRVIAATIAAGLLALVAWSWWPNDQYHPIRPDERGTVFQAVRSDAASLPDDPVGGSGQHMAIGSSRYAMPPTLTLFGQRVPQQPAVPAVYFLGQRIMPAIYVVDGTGTAAASSLRDEVGEALASGGDLSTPPGTEDPPATGEGTGAGTVVVPLPSDPALVPLPAEGVHDNRAIARNVEDGSTVYDTAFTIVWVVGDIVDQTNVADARASCTDCVTVAVAFQVVLVQSEARIVIPENHAVALNVDCDGCTTFAIATQLVFTVPETLTDDAMSELQHLWSALVALEQRIQEIPLADLYGEISALEAAFVSFLSSDTVQAAGDTAAVGAVGAGTGSSTTTVPGTTSGADGPTPGSDSEASTPSETTSPTTTSSTTSTTAPTTTTTAPTTTTTTTAPTTTTTAPTTTTTAPTTTIPEPATPEGSGG